MRPPPSFTVIAIAAICAACVLDQPLVPDSANPPTPRLVIHGVLMVDSAVQKIYVERARLVSDGAGSNVLPLPDSVVRVSVFDEQGVEHAFTRDRDSAAVFHGAFVVSSGATYHLLVIAGPDTATGVVTAPGKPVFTSVPPDTVDAKKSFRFAWRSASDAGFGYKLVTRDADTKYYSTYQPSVWLTADTTVVLGIDLYYAQTDNVLFVLVAIDRAAYSYFGGPLVVDTLPATYGLQPTNPQYGKSTLANAYGVFGAASVVTRRVWF
jgi:hypothetical protein